LPQAVSLLVPGHQYVGLAQGGCVLLARLTDLGPHLEQLLTLIQALVLGGDTILIGLAALPVGTHTLADPTEEGAAAVAESLSLLGPGLALGGLLLLRRRLLVHDLGIHDVLPLFAGGVAVQALRGRRTHLLRPLRSAGVPWVAGVDRPVGPDGHDPLGTRAVLPAHVQFLALCLCHLRAPFRSRHRSSSGPRRSAACTPRAGRRHLPHERSDADRRGPSPQQPRRRARRTSPRSRPPRPGSHPGSPAPPDPRSGRCRAPAPRRPASGECPPRRTAGSSRRRRRSRGSWRPRRGPRRNPRRPCGP